MSSIEHRFPFVAVAFLFAAVPATLFAQQSLPAEGSESQLIAVLQSDAPLFDKAKACQRLAVIGTKQCVPVLAKLLADEKLSHYARYGLEPIPDPAVDDVLRDALGKLKGGLLIGVINSIGMRRDAKAIGDLQKLLRGSDATAAEAAATALGRIATPEAVKVLLSKVDASAALRRAIADACLTAADSLLAAGKKAEAIKIYDVLQQGDPPTHIRIAALQGAIRARGADGLPLLAECLRSKDKTRFRVGLHAAQQMPGPAVTKELLAVLPELKPEGEAAGKELVIVKAEYGAQDKWVDVTEKLAEAALTGNVSVKADNDLAGDPINGVVKQLRVTYKLDGKQHNAVVPEGELFQVDSDAPRDVRQALVIYALGYRGDKTTLPVVLETAKNGLPGARIAAIRVLAGLGDVSAVPTLLETAVEGQGGFALAAKESLAALPGEEVDAKLAALLAKSNGPRRLVVIDTVGRRGMSSAVPTLLQLADSDDEQLRTAAIGALGLTVGLDELAELIDRLVKPKTPGVAPVAKEALRKACQRMPDRDACAGKLLGRMADAPTAAQGDLLDLVGEVGGPKALAGVAAAAKDGDEAVQDAATRVLGGWMSPDAAPVLLELAKSGPEKFRIRTLRGYVRIIRQLRLPNRQKLDMSREAMAVATRAEEKRLVLEALTRIPSPAALTLIVPHMNNPDLKEAASAAAVSVGEQIVDRHPVPVAAAMKKAVDATGNDERRGRAQALLKQAEKKLPGKPRP